MNGINRRYPESRIPLDQLKGWITLNCLDRNMSDRTWKRWRTNLCIEPYAKSLPVGDSLALCAFAHLRSEKDSLTRPVVNLDELIDFMDRDSFALLSCRWLSGLKGLHIGSAVPRIMQGRYGRSWSASWLYRKAGLELSALYSDDEIEAMYRHMSIDHRSSVVLAA